MFEKTRLVLARRKRGYTQKALAEKLDLTPKHFNSYETGREVPPEQTLIKIADELNFPYKFFFGAEIENIDTNYVSFRAMSKMSAKDRDKAIAAADIAMLIVDWISEKFNLPEAAIPDLRGESPQVAADAVRKEWGLGDRPVKNLIHLLESKGVRIFSLTTQPEEIDAFCFWRQKNPYVFVNITKSCERARFDAAHELGHLVLHRHGEIGGREAELEADRFASAFLMPATSVVVECNQFPTIDGLIKKKSIWGVSLAALIHRLHSVSIISEWHYKQLFIAISQRGFRKNEPEPMLHEASQLLKKVVELLREDKKGIYNLANEINVNIDDINALFFGLIMVAIQGNQQADVANSTYVKPNLTLVGSK